MNRHILAICALSLIGCTTIKKPVLTDFVTDKQRLVHDFEHVISGIDPDVNIGVKITSLATGDVVFEKNSKRHFVPSSVIKLITLASALHYLGPSFRFDTIFFTDGYLKPGVINNLYVKGSGDPSLMDFDLLALISELKQMGIKEIAGNIYLDDQIFDNVLWGRGAMWDDRDRGYSAPVCGLNLNYNRIEIKTVPSHQVGGTAHSIIRPAVSYAEIVSRAKTSKSGTGRSISVSVDHKSHNEKDGPALSSDGIHPHDRIVIEGQIAALASPHYNLLAINDPGMFTLAFIKDRLHHMGVTTHGLLLRKAVPTSALKLATHQSRSLAEALIDFTKISNDLANDALVKVIAAQAGEKPATASTGLKRIGQFLTEQMGIDANSLIAADGSGLSRYNLITPDQIVTVLSYAANHFHLGPEFIAALPIGGEDGTLTSRLKADNVKGSIRAKTGSMTGLSGLAGYLIGADNKRYAFAIMINGFVGSSLKYTRMQDQILSVMLNSDQAQLAKVKPTN